MKILVRSLLRIQERKKWVIILEKSMNIRHHLDLKRTRGSGTYCSNNRATLDLDNDTSSIVHRLSSCERMESSRWIVNGVARGCGSKGADRGRPLLLLETADSGPQKTSSEHCDISSLALASTPWGLSPLVASRRRRSTISFSISALRLSKG